MAAWRDTSNQPSLAEDGAWAEARWLVGRHPRVQRLVMRLGVWDDEEAERGRWVHMKALRATVRGLDEYMRARAAYERRNPPPEDDGEYEAWRDAGPKSRDHGPGAAHGPGTAHGVDSVHELAVMSSGEQRLIRLLATIGHDRIEWSTGDLWGLDDEGEAFVRDWISLLLPR